MRHHATRGRLAIKDRDDPDAVSGKQNLQDLEASLGTFTPHAELPGDQNIDALGLLSLGINLLSHMESSRFLEGVKGFLSFGSKAR